VVKSLEKAGSILENGLHSIPENCQQPFKTCRECIIALYAVLPQSFDARGLYVSEFLRSLEGTGGIPFIRSHRDHFYIRKEVLNKWEPDNMLWIAGESLFQAKTIWWGRFGQEILKEGGLIAPATNKVNIVVGPISFFYDKIPDLVYSFFIDPQSPPEPARHLLGLTYAMKEARKSWFFEWVGRLVNTIMKMESSSEFSFLEKYSHLQKAYQKFKEDFFNFPDRAKKLLRVMYAREALEWMARVLAFLGASPEQALLNQEISTFLDYEEEDSIKISQALKDINTAQDSLTLWKSFLSNEDPQGDNFTRSRARLLFIREFLEQSADTINSALDVRDVIKIKGSKSTKLMADLVRHVGLNPLTGKILLLGAPGGGKGLTATRYHELAIKEITKDKEGHLLKETIEGLWKRLINILMLPRARDVMDNIAPDVNSSKKLLDFTKAQLQGTRWWQWIPPLKGGEKGDKQIWACEKDTLCTKIMRDEKGFLEVKGVCASCPLSMKSNSDLSSSNSYLKRLTQDIPSNIANDNSIDLSVQFLAHYLARLLYAVYGIKNEKPQTSGNFIQVLCGSLAEQGPEFISSMRRLFGTAENVEMPMPGLFQTASYMAATVFLDEIADAPIKIQDNLLGPLEEKKVSRLGWESIQEDVGNIRIVAATHKDIRALVKLYEETRTASRQQGFRPDLLSRLIIFPPVYPAPITDYFLYENDDERRINRMDFVSIMMTILEKKAKGVKNPNDDRRRRFLENLFDTIDFYFKRTIEMMDFPKADFYFIKKNLVKQITTRLFVGILEEVALAEQQAEFQSPEISEAFLNARLSDILAVNLPKLLNYIVNPGV